MPIGRARPALVADTAEAAPHRVLEVIICLNPREAFNLTRTAAVASPPPRSAIAPAARVTECFSERRPYGVGFQPLRAGSGDF